MLRFFGWPVATPYHGVLKEFPYRDNALPAKVQDPLVSLEGPAVSGLLMTKEFRDLVMIEERFEHDLR
jgi:hypothetical protein